VSRRKLINIGTLLGSLVAALSLMAAAGGAQALAAAPRWDIITRSAPTHLIPGEEGLMTAVVVNLGDEPVVATQANPIVVTDTLPEGVVAIEAMSGKAAPGAEGPQGLSLTCEKLPALRCTYVGKVPPFISLEVAIPVRAAKTFDHGDNEVRVEGANAPPGQAIRPITQSSMPTPFGVERYELNAEEEEGATDLQAGSHPFQLTTTLELNQTFATDFSHPEVRVPGAPALLRNLNTKLPAGLVGNTLAIPKCSEVDFATIRPGNSNTCPPDTAVGVAVVTYKEPTFIYWKTEAVPVFNLAPAPGEPARFGFEFYQVPVTIDTSLQTGEGYAVEAKVANASEAAEVLGTMVTIWGVPGETKHDNARGWACLGGGVHVANLEHVPPCEEPQGAAHAAPYLTLPTSCAQPLSTSVQAQSWQPGAPLLPPVEPASIRSLESCGSLPFNPSITVAADQHAASTPSGLNVEVTVPQDTTLAAAGLAEADIKETVVTLPEGLQTNAGAADGLETCSVQAAGFSGLNTDTGGVLAGRLEEQQFTSEGVTCPDASKVGEVAIRSPLLENEMKGFVYLAQQDTNPFASPLVLYVIAEDPITGVRVKLAGEVKLTASGQLISVFKNTPPLPFQTLKLHFFDGQRASQATPPLCRSYATTASFVPWSGEPPAERSSSFTPETGPNGTPCQSQGSLPFSPSFQAGSANTQAGAFTPFTLTINRPDGNQALQSITMHLPPGAAAMLASVTPCPEPQASRNECGPESLVGHSTALSGLGSNPVALGGDVYLTGPYKGAPFGLLALTDAKAGPFDLGLVPVRSTITVDPNTAAATITSDPLPQFVKGVPSQIKSLNVTVDRAGFGFNPTNCNPMSLTGTLTGYEGASNAVSSPFQVTNCASLPFKPNLTVSVGKSFSKQNGVSFIVRVSSTHGQANLAKTRLVIPKTLPSRLTTIQKACPDSLFNSTPTPGTACGEGSNIGSAIVHTPVLKNPLKGPAYLVSHGGAAFPDVEFVLQGEGILLILDGQTDIKGGVTTSTFNSVPDAPVETFEAILPAGPHSALTVYAPGKTNLCGSGLVAPTTITGQNGVVIEQSTPVAVEGCSGVAGYKVSQTRAQKLAKALKACRKKKNKSKRISCEKAARKLYASKASKHHKKK